MQSQQTHPEETFDLIVVGAGVAGCILAARIAQSGVNPRNGEKLRVAVFEYGPYFRGEVRRGYGVPSRRGAFDNLPYEDLRYSLPWGGGEAQAMVGGSAMHAGLIAHPPLPIDFEHWREETGVNWTWEKFNLAMAELYEMFHPYPEPPEVRSPGQERFKRAALSLGYDVLEIAQAKLNCVRCGDCNGRLCKYDAKSTPLVTYAPIAERAGVQFIPHTLVEKLVIEKKNGRPVATGVIYRRDGVTRQAKAAKLLVSCGATGTPRLLFRSGYGPREKVSGELLAENRNVGSNVCTSLRPGELRAFFKEVIKFPDIGAHSVYGVEKVYGPRGYHHLLVAESMGDKAGTRTYPQDYAMSIVAPQFGREFKQYMRIAHLHEGHMRFEFSKNKIRGEINVDGGPELPGGAGGTISTEYLARHFPEYIEPLREGLEIAKKVMKAMGPPAKLAGSLEIPERMGGGNWIASCRAGANRQNSVVNSDFESHDVDNLFICDGSVVPAQCRWNASMPIAAVSAYAWRRIVANHFSRA